MKKNKTTGCLPQSVYKDSVKNKTIKSVIKWMIDQVCQHHGCLTGDCPHYKQEDCVEALCGKWTKEEG